MKSTNPLVLNEMTHFVIVIEGTTLKLYKNGTLDSSQEISFTIPRLNRKYRYIGRSIYDHGAGAAGGSFYGTIAYFRIWDGKALSSSEVLSLYETRDRKITDFDKLLYRSSDNNTNIRQTLINE